jgi:FAD:protein FMN transferase
LNGNAVAKGFAVDAVARHVMTTLALRRLVVNVGGEVVHVGEGSVQVHIENPLRAYDNEPAIQWVEIADAAIATSGSSRRGFEIAGARYSHIIDPRTGYPVDKIVAASVIAPTVEAADAYATIASVLGPEAADSLPPDVGYRITLAGGEVLTNTAWDDRVIVIAGRPR